MKSLPKNERERQIAQRYLNNGWEVLHKGWPDFLMFKDGKIRMIEVKRTQRRITKKMGLSAHQKRVRELLSVHQDYEVIYVD